MPCRTPRRGKASRTSSSCWSAEPARPVLLTPPAGGVRVSAIPPSARRRRPPTHRGRRGRVPGPATPRASVDVYLVDVDLEAAGPRVPGPGATPWPKARHPPVRGRRPKAASDNLQTGTGDQPPSLAFSVSTTFATAAACPCARTSLALSPLALT